MDHEETESPDEIFLIALLGRSPAVITELLWHLVMVEEAQIAGIEMWTTSSTVEGAEHIEATARVLQALAEALPPGCLPAVRQPPTLVAAPPPWNEPPSVRFVGVQRADGAFIEDVAHAQDAQLIDAALYERVRQLRRTLPHTIRLVGSLAGGRKTMSTALHTAFSLQARIQDRLVHVFPEARLDAKMGKSWQFRTSYAWPTEEVAEQTGVPMTDQVKVVDVAFPLVRWLAPKPLQKVLDDKDYEAYWSEFRERGANEAAHGWFTGDDSQPRADWRLTVEWPDGHRADAYLPLNSGMILRALMAHPEGLHLIDLASKVRGLLQLHGRRQFDDEPAPSAETMRTAVLRLSEKLHKQGVPHHLLPVNFGDGTYGIPRATQITEGEPPSR